MSDVYDMTNFPDRADDFIPIYGGSENDWHEVTVTARGAGGLPGGNRRYDALLSAPFAVVYNHERLLRLGGFEVGAGVARHGPGADICWTALRTRCCRCQVV